MTKVLFVCLGNICRSPMAEFIFRDIVNKNNRANDFIIASAATIDEEIGNPVYPPARKKLEEHGIDCTGKIATKIKKSDYEKYDYILGMEKSNVDSILRIVGGDPENKVHLLLEFAGDNGNISDPYFTRDFDKAYNDISRGVSSLWEYLNKKI